MAPRATPILVGCCGFVPSQAEYCRRYPAVEIATTFYNLPRLATAARWRALTPPGFQFALRAWQVITHHADSPTYARTRLDPRDREHCGGFRWNATTRWAWDATWRVAKELDAFLVLLQPPASFRPTKENVANLRSFAERAKRGRAHLGWEPRGPWPAELVAGLCRELDLVHVVNPLVALPATPRPFRYFRPQGGPAPLRAEELVALRDRCRQERTPVYCFFNHRAMAADAARFAALLSS